MTSSYNWNLDPPPGFQGLRDDIPLKLYHRHLPHWRQDGATYFVTFRLADSLPKTKLRELDALRKAWKGRTDCQSVTSTDSRKDCQSVLHDPLSLAIMKKVEGWLDNGYGECWLKEPAVTQIVRDAMHYGDGLQYELGACVLMPNHVHAILRPLSSADLSLERILQSRKRRTAALINAHIDRDSRFWQSESYDRIIRDEEHLWRCVQYIGSNPSRAKLKESDCYRWISSEWQKKGWDFL
jgi:putative transposase